MRFLGLEGINPAVLIAIALLSAVVIMVGIYVAGRAEQRRNAERMALLKAEFAQLSHEILAQKSAQLQSSSEERLQSLLIPLREQLGGFQTLLRESHRAGLSQHVDLKAELNHMRALNQQLSQDAGALTRALKGDNKAQGNWGEMQLERLLESAGLRKGVHFETQVSVPSANGARQQPDVVVRLPQGRDIVIDAKVSLSAYSRWYGGDGAALKDHLVSLRSHISGLSARAYEQSPAIRSLDFVLLFVPIEGALNDALRADPALVEFAQSRNIVLSSTTTLLLMLKTVASLWRIEQQNQNADEIARQAGQLHDKFAALYADLLRVQQQFDGTQRAFGDVLGKLKDGRGSLLARAENLRQLGAKTAKSLPGEVADGHNSDEEVS